MFSFLRIFHKCLKSRIDFHPSFFSRNFICFAFHIVIQGGNFLIIQNVIFDKQFELAVVKRSTICAKYCFQSLKTKRAQKTWTKKSDWRFIQFFLFLEESRQTQKVNPEICCEVKTKKKNSKKVLSALDQFCLAVGCH